MEKDLKENLISFRKTASPQEICDYFTWDFADDYDEYEKNILYPSQLDVLSFLNDEFIDIDIDYYHTNKFESKVYETIDKAIAMLE